MTGTPAPPRSLAVQTVFDDTNAEAIHSYAEAAFEAGQAAGNTEDFVSEVETVAAEVFAANPEFVSIFTAPNISTSAKDGVIRKTLEGKVAPLTLNFLRVLNRHDRIELLPSIGKRMRALINRKLNRKPAVIRSAVPLSPEEQERLRAKLANLLGGTPALSYVVDPELIAGLSVEAGDDIYDASARNQLNRIRSRLIEEKSHEISSRRNQFSDPS